MKRIWILKWIMEYNGNDFSVVEKRFSKESADSLANEIVKTSWRKNLEVKVIEEKINVKQRKRR